MSDDRELLELAARSIGFTALDLVDAGVNLGTDAEPIIWNPLTDDGDALRLAVKLGIKVTPYPIFSHEKHSVIASRRWFAPPDDDENTYVGVELAEVYGADPYAATRRAIVRAAAEIGKSSDGGGTA